LMRKTQLSIPALALVAATRGMLGAGIGLLLGDRLAPDARKAAGWTLVAVGVLTTIPLAIEVFGGSREIVPGASSSGPSASAAEQDLVRTAAAA
jgi:hypothetical protein